MKRSWLKHGALNTLEHGLTRVADAGTTIVLLWSMSPETFSKLALAQAWVAPLLLFFVSPEQVIYRDFAKWKAEGTASLAARLRALRLFAWGKAQAAVVLSAGIAWAGSAEAWTQFWALLWAFALSLAPQIAGPDREYLRMDLRLEELNAISLYQKVSLLLGTAVCGIQYPGRIDLLAGVAIFSAVTTAWLAWSRTRQSLSSHAGAKSSGESGPSSGTQGSNLSVFAVLADSLGTFSIWSHISGVVTNWIQTMDLFFLGVMGASPRETGLYAAVLKLANFSLALPTALSNLFSVRIGRKLASDSAGAALERAEVRKYSLVLTAGAVIQAGLLLTLAPWILEFLSRGRWSPDEESRMTTWLAWLLSGTVLFSSTFLAGAWLTLRESIRALFLRVSIPWGLCAAAIYSAAAATGGADAVAVANLSVGGAGLVLVWLEWRRPGKVAPAAE